MILAGVAEMFSERAARSLQTRTVDSVTKEMARLGGPTCAKRATDGVYRGEMSTPTCPRHCFSSKRTGLAAYAFADAQQPVSLGGSLCARHPGTVVRTCNINQSTCGRQ